MNSNLNYKNENINLAVDDQINKDLNSPNTVIKSLGKKKNGNLSENNDTISSASINTLSASCKRPLRQFSVKNRNNSTSSFKTTSLKSHKSGSNQDLNELLTKQASNSPRSFNSQDGFYNTSMQRIRSIEETNRKRQPGSLHNNSSNVMYGRQLAKTRSRNSSNGRQTKHSSPNDNKVKNSKSISPLSQHESNSDIKSQDFGLESKMDSSNSNVKEELKPFIYDQYSETAVRRKSHNNSTKTFNLESDSDCEEEVEEQNVILLNDNLNNQINVVPDSESSNQANISKDQNFNAKTELQGLGKESINNAEGYFLNNSVLLKINNADISLDSNRLSYVVPSSYRKNSRVSADRISAGLIVRRVSQSNSDLINNSLIDIETHEVENNGLEYTNGASLKPQYSLQHNNMSPTNITSLEANDKQTTKNISNNFKNSNGDLKFNNIVESEQQQVDSSSGNNVIDKGSTNLTFLNNNKNNDIEFSSFSSSFMKDKNSSHQFNYINKDFLNSSTSNEIKKYFSNNHKIESFSAEMKSNNSKNINDSTNELIDDESIKDIRELNTGLISSNTTAEQVRLNRLKQASRNQLKLIQNNQQESNMFAEKMNDTQSKLKNRGMNSTTKDEQVLREYKNTQYSDKDTGKSFYESINSRSPSVPSAMLDNNAIYNSSNLATKSLLKIATMANNSSPPIKKLNDSSKSDFNDFNSFLKSDTPTEDKDSRTQQRLWLQRESSILDLSADLSQKQFDSVFQASSVDAKRGFENIAKEYKSIKRFKNPLVENVKKVHMILGNENSNENKDANTYHIDLINGSATVSTTARSKSSISNSNTKNSISALNNNAKDDFDGILSSIWNNETKKMIDGQPTKYISHNQFGGQSSNNLMRQSITNSNYYRNSPRGIHSTGGFR